MKTDPITAIADAIAALATFGGKALPSDAERLERLKVNHPWLYARALKRAEKQRNAQIELQLQAIEKVAKFAEEKGVRPEVLANYIWGDTSRAEILRQLIDKKE